MTTITNIRSFNDVYCELLKDLLGQADAETNERTGEKIRMLEGGTSFKLSLENGRLPVAGNRRYYPHVAAAEVAWQFMGTKDPSWILGKAPKIWQDFTEDDGTVECAYGYRWRRHFGRDQLALALGELQRHPTNRQIYVSAWDPYCDGLGGPQPKNVPCPVGFSLTRTGDLLHISVFIRSSDVFVGLPYDVMTYALTLDAMAAALDLKPGTLHFTLAHAHVYEEHWKFVNRSVTDRLVKSNWLGHEGEPQLPCVTVHEIEKQPDEYVERVRRLTGRAEKHDWDPKPVVVV